MSTTTGAPFDIEQAAFKGRILRECAVANGQPYKAIDELTKWASGRMREQAAGEAEVIEWGRALVTAAAVLGTVLVDLKDGNPAVDKAGVLLNMLGWAGLDLLDGNR